MLNPIAVAADICREQSRNKALFEYCKSSWESCYQTEKTEDPPENLMSFLVNLWTLYIRGVFGLTLGFEETQSSSITKDLTYPVRSMFNVPFTMLTEYYCLSK